jgi:hypothetical protein
VGSEREQAGRATRRVGVIVAVVAIMVAVTGVRTPEARADTTNPSCAASDPFTPALAQQLATTWPGQTFTASVFDERTGCQYDLHPDARIGTASVLKVEIMAGILLRAQNQGRGLTPQEASLVLPMITQSDNNAATSLWQSLGGAPAMTYLDGVFGMGSTTPATPQWGLTSTSARDQVTLLRQVLNGDFGPLAPAYRASALGYMTSVTPSQRWGITAGVPSGWTVANKNGWAPGTNGLWNVNSTGAVYDPAGGSYVVALLSTGWPDEATGITGIETLNRAVAAHLTAPSSPHFYLTDQTNPPVTAADLLYGNPGDFPLVGDWNGDGTDTVGIHRGNTFYLRNSNTTGVADITFNYGDPGDVPIVGDWNGDGVDTVGVIRGNTFYLRNSNTTGPADITFTYGNPGDRPLVGDWNGDHVDTIGLERGNTFYLRDSNTSGIADQTFSYGNPNDYIIAGDWNGDHVTTVGVVRGNTFYLRNTNTSGFADQTFSYGNPGDWPLAGDWNGDGTDTVGVVRLRG